LHASMKNLSFYEKSPMRPPNRSFEPKGDKTAVERAVSGSATVQVGRTRRISIFYLAASSWGSRWGTSGGGLMSKPGTCFTKQTGDMVYTMAENSWLSQLWLDA